MKTRREFLVGGAAVAASVLARGMRREEKTARLPIAFSTLACPDWKWAKILEYAQANGFAAIELRGLLGNLDLPSSAEFSSERMAQTKSEIAEHGLKIACVSSSAHMGEMEEGKRAKELADGKRFIDLAQALDAPYVRVFGPDSEDEKPRVSGGPERARVARDLKELGEYAGARRVVVLIESHDNFVTSAVLSEVLQRADSEHVGLLWDAHHTFADGKESPEFTVSNLGRWIRHTHIKDSVPDGDERKYVLTGRGDGPIRRQVSALKKLGYAGFYCFEWEKVWHPELTDPEIAVGDYAKVMSGYLRDAR